MFRSAVVSLLIAVPASAQIRTLPFDPSGRSQIIAGHTLPNGDILIGGYTEAGLVPMVNAFQPKHGSSGLRRTLDGGRTWVEAQRPAPTLLRLVADYTDAAVLYAFDDKTLYRSTDAAETWTPILSEQALDVQTSIAAPTTIYALTATELLISPDRGETWSRHPLPAVANARFSRIAVDPFQRSTLYACGASGLYGSSNAGANWAATPFPLAAFTCSGIHFDPSKAGVVYAAVFSVTPSASVWRSTNGMATWTQLTGVSGGVAVDPIHSGVLFGYTTNASVMSDDYGDTWKILPIARGVGGLIVVIPGEPSTIIYPQDVSYDGGLTWYGRSPGTVTGVTACRASPGTAYMLTSPQFDGFFARIAPSGEIRFSTMLGGSRRDYVTSVASDDRGNTYAAGYTISDDFPTTPGVLQRKFISSFSNGFVAKFDPDGALVWSTMTRAQIDAIAVDRDYSVVFLSGWLGRLSPQGDSIEYFDGDAVRDPARGFPYLTHMALTARGEIVVAGRVNPPILSTRTPFVVVRVDSQGALISKVTLGARGDVSDLAIDPQGNAVFSGYLASDGLVTTPGAWEPSRPGYIPTFVTRISPLGAVVSSTLFGSHGDVGYSMALTSNGDAVISGYVTNPRAFRAVNPAVIPADLFPDERRYFVARVSADGTTARYAFLIPSWNLVALSSDDVALFQTRSGLVFLNLSSVDP